MKEYDSEIGTTYRVNVDANAVSKIRSGSIRAPIRQRERLSSTGITAFFGLHTLSDLCTMASVLLPSI